MSSQAFYGTPETPAPAAPGPAAAAPAVPQQPPAGQQTLTSSAGDVVDALLPVNHEKYTADDAKFYREQLEKLIAAVAGRDEEIEKSRERHEKIQKVSADIHTQQQRLIANNAYIAQAEAEVKDFPSEADLNTLKEKLDTLKIELEKAEGAVFTSQTGIQAYAQRRQRNFDSMVALSNSAGNALKEMLVDIGPLINDEESVTTAQGTINAIETMRAIDESREDDLQALLKTLEYLLSQEVEKTAENARLKQEGEENLPRIESERSIHSIAIEEAWEEERTYLKSILDQLVDLNKEQQYHLARGTHIKRQPTPITEAQLNTLSTQNARFIEEAQENSDTLQNLKEELGVLRKNAVVFREAGRQQTKYYEDRIASKQIEVEEATAALEAAKSEGDELRNIKAELTHALHDMRDARTLLVAAGRR